MKTRSRSRTRRRRTGLRLRVGALIVSVAVAATVTASAQTPELRATEGEWTGFVAFVGAQTLSFRGSFGFTSAAGEVDGTFQWSSGDIAIGGVVSGPDARPRFDLTSVVSGGTSIPDVSGGGEILFTVATCERLEGTGVNIDVERVGIEDIVWWAIRDDATGDPGAFFESLQALRQDVGDVLDSLVAGRIVVGGVFDRIEPALAEAERLAAQLDRTEGCGGEFYRSLIASEIEFLVLFVLDNPDMSIFELGQLLITAARAGVIGAGSGPEPGFLEVQVKELMGERIGAAIEAEDTIELELLGIIAEEVGWDDLADEALFALVGFGE